MFLLRLCIRMNAWWYTLPSPRNAAALAYRPTAELRASFWILPGDFYGHQPDDVLRSRSSELYSMSVAAVLKEISIGRHS
jgi:hypothetical protein